MLSNKTNWLLDSEQAFSGMRMFTALCLGALVSVATAASTVSANLYSTATRSPGAVVTGDANYLFHGCYSDQGNTRLLTGGQVSVSTTVNSVQDCLYYCTVTVSSISLVKWNYAAIENYGTCYCGSTLNLITGNAAILTGGVNGNSNLWLLTIRANWHLDNTLCLPSCIENPSQACGGPGYALVYMVRPTTQVIRTVSGDSNYKLAGTTGCFANVGQFSGLFVVTWTVGSVEECLYNCKISNAMYAALEAYK